jgi:hypothetical protein
MTTVCIAFVAWALLVVAVLAIPPLARAVGAAVLILLAIAAVALAEERRPMPVPSPSGSCPTGWSYSPTSRMCAPTAVTRCSAFPSPGGSCPTGWTYSPTSRMCVEVGC